MRARRDLFQRRNPPAVATVSRDWSLGWPAGRPDETSGFRTYDADVASEDTPELTWVDGLVIGVVCLASGGAFVLGTGAFAVALVTRQLPSIALLPLLSVGAVVAAVTARGTYFLAGRTSPARRHPYFGAILYWGTGVGVLGALLSLAGVWIRAVFGFR